MDGGTFDRLTKVAVQTSRRGFLGALMGVVMTVNLVPGRDTRAQSGGGVVLGGACMTTADCQQATPGMCMTTAVCGDNGFASDGPLSCCTENCCQSDADCCGDLRCAPTYETGWRCRLPPFPTRSAGQVCTSNSDCFSWPGRFAQYVDQRCQCRDPYRPMPEPPEISYIPDRKAAHLCRNRPSTMLRPLWTNGQHHGHRTSDRMPGRRIGSRRARRRPSWA
jgi:hypothetical protein